jgi:hypothetical protein
MKTELEKAIIELGKVLEHNEESIDTVDTDILKMLATILNLEVDNRQSRVYN